FGLIKRPADVTEAAHRAHAAHELIHFVEAGFRASAAPTPTATVSLSTP
ncbi:MAG: TetR/AcrR family transcriptional regulator, partial [Stenotrophomonas sp.]